MGGSKKYREIISQNWVTSGSTGNTAKNTVISPDFLVCLSAKFPHQKSGEITVFFAVENSVSLIYLMLKQVYSQS